MLGTLTLCSSEVCVCVTVVRNVLVLVVVMNNHI